MSKYVPTADKMDQMLAQLIPKATRADEYDRNGRDFRKEAQFQATCGHSEETDPDGWQVLRSTLERHGKEAIAYWAERNEFGYSLELVFPNTDAIRFYDEQMIEREEAAKKTKRKKTRRR